MPFQAPSTACLVVYLTLQATTSSFASNHHLLRPFPQGTFYLHLNTPRLPGRLDLDLRFGTAIPAPPFAVPPLTACLSHLRPIYLAAVTVTATPPPLAKAKGKKTRDNASSNRPLDPIASYYYRLCITFPSPLTLLPLPLNQSSTFIEAPRQAGRAPRTAPIPHSPTNQTHLGEHCTTLHCGAPHYTTLQPCRRPTFTSYPPNIPQLPKTFHFLQDRHMLILHSRRRASSRDGADSSSPSSKHCRLCCSTHPSQPDGPGDSFSGSLRPSGFLPRPRADKAQSI